MPGTRPPQERPGDARVLDCLYRVGAFVNETEDPREALDFILEEIVRTLNASSASIAVLTALNPVYGPKYRDPSRTIRRVRSTRGYGPGVTRMYGYPRSSRRRTL